MSGERALRLLPEDGTMPEDAPGSYAEALIALDEARRELQNTTARGKLLAQENEHLTAALGKAHGQIHRLKAEQNKNLRLHRDYATVERLWLEKYRPHHPRCREEIPADWLKLGLERLRDFDEAGLARALDGARLNPPRSDDGKTAYDKWDNVFRSTGHVHRYIERADQAEGRAHRPREQVPEVREALSALNVVRLEDLAARCRCGHLMVEHTARLNTPEAPHPCRYDDCGCTDADDLDWQIDRRMRASDEGRRWAG